MTEEEINRKFDLVADHLANIAQAQMKADARIGRLERVLALAIRANQRERRETRDKINALVDAQTRAEARHEREYHEAHDKINTLVDAQTRAEARHEREYHEAHDKINALIDAQTRAEARHAETEEKIGILTTAMTDLAQALTATNKRIDVLESNKKK